MTNTFAIAYDDRGTTLWLNKFWAGGFIYSTARTQTVDRGSYQPALRFPTIDAAQAFIAQHLGGNPNASVVAVTD